MARRIGASVPQLARFAGVLAVATVAAAISPAAAHPNPASPVKITFTVNLESSTPAASRQCSLEVPKGTDGIGVLQAAVDQECIVSYRVSDSRYAPPAPQGPSPKGRHWLRCIDAVCDVEAVSIGVVPVTRWSVVWGAGGSQRYWEGGLERYSASRGDAFVADLRAYN